MLHMIWFWRRGQPSEVVAQLCLEAVGLGKKLKQEKKNQRVRKCRVRGKSERHIEKGRGEKERLRGQS